MIIRHTIACETCNHLHTLRIGMGQEEKQTHRFKCRGCSEDIVVSLEVDYANLTTAVVLDENAKHESPTKDASIVNLEADFLIPEEDQGKDLAFSRLEQQQEWYRVAEEKYGTDLQQMLQSFNGGAYRRPNYAEEWKLLKKAWSLHLNDREKLSIKKIRDASQIYYPRDPLKTLPDWVWRFCSQMGQQKYEQLFLDAIKPVHDQIRGSAGLIALGQYYEANMRRDRAVRYFNIFKEYFAAYSEFSQVQFTVANDLAIPADRHASSTDFAATRMFYGNAYEALAHLVDFLALLNNLLSARDFDKFQQLTLKEYNKLDSPSRFGPFNMRAPFMALCQEADNQIRNGSHHGRFELQSDAQTIRYRVGKGGTGAEMTMTYASYLIKCVRLFMQIQTLLRLELAICSSLGLRSPV